MQISEEEFNEVYKEYFPRLLGHSKKILKRHDLAEDMVHEVFSRLLKEDFNKIKGHLKQWLFLVSYTCSLKQLKKENRFIEAIESDTISEDADPFENLNKKEMYKDVFSLIKKLGPKQQEILKLRFYSDLQYKQIAKKMKTTEGSVGFHLSISLRDLRKEFAKSVDKR